MDWAEYRRSPYFGSPSPRVLELAAAEQQLRAEYRLRNLPPALADKAIDLAADLARCSHLTSFQAVERLSRLLDV